MNFADFLHWGTVIVIMIVLHLDALDKCVLVKMMNQCLLHANGENVMIMVNMV
jgi:hypothetical protein